jgi:hypothetical protein
MYNAQLSMKEDLNIENFLLIIEHFLQSNAISSWKSMVE